MNPYENLKAACACGHERREHHGRGPCREVCMHSGCGCDLFQAAPARRCPECGGAMNEVPTTTVEREVVDGRTGRLMRTTTIGTVLACSRCEHAEGGGL
jgi:hypothetical protein